MKQFINKKNRKRLIAGAAALTMLTAAFAGTLSVSAQEDTMVRSFLTGKPVPESIGRKKAISVMRSRSPASPMRKSFMKLRSRAVSQD